MCDQSGAEDLVAVPGTPWVVASGMAMNGGVRLVNTRTLASTTLFPSGTAQERPDRQAYAACPGPFDAAGKAAFKAHGLYLYPGRGGLFTLLVVHHGSRESIEVFELETRSAAPFLTWTGCVVAPEPIGLNSVAGLPDGGFLTTNFQPRNADQAARARMMEGEKNGELWEWHSASAWQKVPGTESAGPNGIEDLQRRQVDLSGTVGQPVVDAPPARADAGEGRHRAARIPRRQLAVGARRDASGGGAGRGCAESSVNRRANRFRSRSTSPRCCANPTATSSRSALAPFSWAMTCGSAQCAARRSASFR